MTPCSLFFSRSHTVTTPASPPATSSGTPPVRNARARTGAPACCTGAPVRSRSCLRPTPLALANSTTRSSNLMLCSTTRLCMCGMTGKTNKNGKTGKTGKRMQDSLPVPHTHSPHNTPSTIIRPQPIPPTTIPPTTIRPQHSLNNHSPHNHPPTHPSASPTPSTSSAGLEARAVTAAPSGSLTYSTVPRATLTTASRPSSEPTTTLCT